VLWISAITVLWIWFGMAIPWYRFLHERATFSIASCVCVWMGTSSKQAQAQAASAVRLQVGNGSLAPMPLAVALWHWVGPCVVTEYSMPVPLAVDKRGGNGASGGVQLEA